MKELDLIRQSCARFFDATTIPTTLFSQAAEELLFSVPEWGRPLSSSFCQKCSTQDKPILLIAQGGITLAAMCLSDGMNLIVGPVFTAGIAPPPDTIYSQTPGEKVCPELSSERFISAFSLLFELITGRKILLEDLITVEAPSIEIPYEQEVSNQAVNLGLLHSGEEYEQRIYDLIESGDTERLSALLQTPSNLTIDIMSPDPVQHQKYLFITFMTMAVRAAIRGGLPSGIAFDTSRHYCLLMDSSPNIREITGHTYNLAMSLCRGVRRIGHDTGFSRLRGCIDFINQHLYEPLNAVMIADATGMSIRSLYDHFKKELHISPMSYVEKRRIEEAQYLLRFGDEKISQIAVSLQFCSQSHFTTVFKRHCGVTPSMYRKK